MKTLTTYVVEKFRVSKDMKMYTYIAKTFKELRKIIEQRYEEKGPGTAQKPIDFNDIDVSGLKTFYNKSTINGIFEHTQFEYIDVSNWDVSNIKYMNWMFHNCKKLKSIGDLSNWNVSNVKYMSNMFRTCENLTFIEDLSNWNVSNVEDMRNMFYKCKNLKSVGDLSKWKTSNVKYMYNMFYKCKNLKSVGDLSNWNVSKVKDMRNMFKDTDITNIPNWYKE